MSPSAIALWHALMSIDNKARWPRDFSVAISTLRSKTGIGKDAIYTARNQLKQKGRIAYRERKGNQSTLYHIISFASGLQTQTPTQTPTQVPMQTPTQTPNNNKPNQTKPNQTNNDDVDDGAFARDETGKLLTPGILFTECFQQTPSTIEIKHCLQLLKMNDPDLVEFAFERAAEIGQKNLAYVRGILNRLHNRGIKDMGDMADYDMSHERGRA